MLAARYRQRTSLIQRYLTAVMAGTDAKERRMISKVLSAAVMAGLLMAVSAPVVAYAADAPKTKAACKKVTGMKWDKKTKTCMKK
jgi:ABC-type Fe2+-enterobactin transport system substrate-binding protein